MKTGKSKKFFNTAGPVNLEDHYAVSPLRRIELEEVLPLIDQKKYFVLHAPRQTGKTSCLLALRNYLNQREEYRCLYINVEVGQSARENVDAAMRAILGQLGYAWEDTFHSKEALNTLPGILEAQGGHNALFGALRELSLASPLPLVLVIDEIDALIGDTLISVLRQLRAGYSGRGREFPGTIILCGVRDVRDYRIHSGMGKEIITGGSAFNIKAESLRLGNFNYDDIVELYGAHTAETGQPFEEAVFPLVWDLTRGQPWLVNALAYEACFKMRPGRDRSKPVTVEIITQAKERLILRRDTHLDQLADKLSEERVRRVIGPMLAGDEAEEQFAAEDIQYVIDLGLIDRTPNGELIIGNEIYREIIPREMTWAHQSGISHNTAWYVDPDGSLNMEKLLSAFQGFFREHSESWVERFQYKEAGPQLLLQAFLQRIVNGGGRVEREYGLGRMRTDLLIFWPKNAGVAVSGGAAAPGYTTQVGNRTAASGTVLGTGRAPAPDAGTSRGETGAGGSGEIQKEVLELKVLHKSLEQTISQGLEQTARYMERCGVDRGHLLIFDRRPEVSWDEKIWRREERVPGRLPGAADTRTDFMDKTDNTNAAGGTNKTAEISSGSTGGTCKKITIWGC